MNWSFSLVVFPRGRIACDSREFSIVSSKFLKWWGQWGTIPRPSDYIPLRLSSPLQFVVWTIPSPSSFSLGCSPSSLYTFPFGLGSGLPSALPVKGSPNLGCVRQEFPPEASIESPPLYLLSYGPFKFFCSDVIVAFWR